jgi:hypothetical protein
MRVAIKYAEPKLEPAQGKRGLGPLESKVEARSLSAVEELQKAATERPLEGKPCRKYPFWTQRTDPACMSYWTHGVAADSSLERLDGDGMAVRHPHSSFAPRPHQLLEQDKNPRIQGAQEAQELIGWTRVSSEPGRQISTAAQIRDIGRGLQQPSRLF